MTTNTTSQEQAYILQTYVKGVYPGAASVDDYYDATALTPKVPSSTSIDRAMQIIVETILYTRFKGLYGYGDQLTAAEKKELYEDVKDNLIDVILAIQTVETAIEAAWTALP
jgi:hypothetical protein